MRSRILALLTLTVGLVMAAGLVNGRIVLTAAQSQPAAPAVSVPSGARALTDLQDASVMFVENVGQFDEHVRFQVRGGDYALWLTDDALWITALGWPSEVDGQGQLGSRRVLTSPSTTSPPQPGKGVNVRLGFVGANPHPLLEPFHRLDTTVSYFIGNQLTRWRANVPVWRGVCYKDLYPGIDLELTSEGEHWQSHLVLHPGADLSAVHLRVEGVEELSLKSAPCAFSGEKNDSDSMCLCLATVAGDFSFLLPSAYPEGSQTWAGSESLKASPILSGRDVYYSSVSLSSARQRSGPDLDPVWDEELIHGKVEENMKTSFQDDSADLSYATFIGGQQGDVGRALAVDSEGAAYVAGSTWSFDFPTTPGAFDIACGTDGNCDDGFWDGFIVKLAPDGGTLAYATFLGGSHHDYAYALAIDSSGAAYLGGLTQSYDFPTTTGALDTACGTDGGCNGHSDAFITKLAPDGSSLAYSTYLGGESHERVSTLAVSADREIYAAGDTWSFDFPTTSGALDVEHNGGEQDAFVVKLTSDGSTLAYATFLGGEGNDRGRALAVNPSGATYVAGQTLSPDFPTTPGAFDRNYHGNWDVFVAELATDGSSLAYATFLGGADADYANVLAVHSAGMVYVAGSTRSPTFPTTPGTFDTTCGIDGRCNGDYDDAFVAKLASDGSSLVYATFLGGLHNDYAHAIAVDSEGAAYVAGYTAASDFPTTPVAFDTSYNGGWRDAFIAKLSADGDSLAYATFLGGEGSDHISALTVGSNGMVLATGGTWSSDFPTTPGAFDTTKNGYYEDAFVARISVSETCRAYVPLIVRNYTPPVTFPLYIGDTIPVRPVAYQGEVFYAKSVQFPPELPSGGHFYFSSQSDAVVAVLVDDELAVLLHGAEVFAYDFSTSGIPVPAIVEAPRATMEQLAGQTVTIEYRDVYSDVVEASEMWLIWTP